MLSEAYMKELIVCLFVTSSFLQANIAHAELSGDMAAHCAAVLLYAAGDSQGENKAKFQSLKNEYVKQCAQMLGEEQCLKTYQLNKLVAQQMTAEKFWQRASECVQASN
jgi:hypothetical protein